MTDPQLRTRQRILMLIPELGYGGAEQSFLRLSNLLGEHHEVSIAVFKQHYAKGGYAQTSEDIGLPMTILDAEVPLTRLLRWTSRWLKLSELKKNADVTISFLTGANILNVATPGPGRTVISMRGSRHYDPRINRAERFLYEYIIDPITFKFSDRITSISDGLTTEISAHAGQNTRLKIETIKLFIDSEDLIAKAYDPIEEEIEGLKGQPIVIATGRLSPEKGFQHLIPVFADVRRRIPDAKLILIGDGPLHQTIVNLCKTLDLPLSDGANRLQESAVIFLGYRKDPLRYFRIAQLFVLSSLTEGFSNCLIEALAAGVPVLAADCPWGPRSILWKLPKDVTTPYPTETPTRGDYGILMPRIDKLRYRSKWVDAICTMLYNPRVDKEAAELQRDRVRELDYHRIGQKWLDLVDELNRPIQIRQRILMLIPELGYGGAETLFLRLAHLLSEHHDILIAVFKQHYAKGGYTHAYEDVDVPVTILDDEVSLSRFRRWTSRWLKLSELKKNADVTISFLTGANMLNVATRGPGHTIISMHGSRRYDPRISRIERFLFEYILDPLTFKLSDRLVSVSDGLSMELSTHVGCQTQRKLKIIEVFIDAEDLIGRAHDPIEKEIEKLKGQPIVIATGRLSPEKGFQHLIPIFADVRRRIPNAKLILIGDGPLYQTLVDQCKTLDLPLSDGANRLQKSAVIFLGYRKDPLRYFRIARLFVLSSLTEGFPNGLIEALAAGIPILSTNCPWGPRSILWKNPVDIRTPYPTETSTQADYGTLMPRIDEPRYRKKWVDAICTMLDDSIVNKEAAELGRARVRELDYSRIGQKWLDLVDDLNRSISK